MTVWMKESVLWMGHYRDEMLFAILIVLIILMLILLGTVRKNMRQQTQQVSKVEQMIRLWENGLKKEANEKEAIKEDKKHVEEPSENDKIFSNTQEKKSLQQKQEEELFGKVLQEYFP